MAEEKQKEEQIVNDALSADDTDVLRLVLRSERARGITPVAVYRQAELDEPTA